MRWLLSWTLYWLGHIVSKPMNWFDWGTFYPLYNWLMCKSQDIQGKGNKGPWKWASQYFEDKNK